MRLHSARYLKNSSDKNCACGFIEDVQMRAARFPAATAKKGVDWLLRPATTNACPLKYWLKVIAKMPTMRRELALPLRPQRSDRASRFAARDTGRNNLLAWNTLSETWFIATAVDIANSLTQSCIAMVASLQMPAHGTAKRAIVLRFRLRRLPPGRSRHPCRRSLPPPAIVDSRSHARPCWRHKSLL
jgi:hypothetical protein